MTASDKGHLDVVKTLIEAGANVNHTNKVGISFIALHSSAGLYICTLCHNDAMGTSNLSILLPCWYHLQVVICTCVHVCISM